MMYQMLFVCLSVVAGVTLGFRLPSANNVFKRTADSSFQKTPDNFKVYDDFEDLLPKEVSKNIDTQSYDNNNVNVHTHVGGIRKRSSETVKEFSMSGEMDSTINWNMVDTDAQTKSVQSLSDFGSIDVCPTNVTEGKDYPTEIRSTCPWYYVTDHDATRFPTTILSARTPCKKCIGSDFECVGITKKIDVLKKSATPSPDGSYQWLESEVTVTVGFTCAGRRLGDNAATPAPEGTTPLYE